MISASQYPGKLRTTLEEPRDSRILRTSISNVGVCLHCGTKISERRMRYGAKYCNDECKNKYRLNQLKKEAVSLRQTCMFCDEPISEKKKRYRALYCSDGCRNHAKIKRAKERIEDAVAEKQNQRDEEREAWQKFDQRHPNIWLIIISEALAFIEMGKVPSFGAIIEYKVRLMQGVKIPNAYKKFYREKFIREYPEYKHLFGEK